MVELGDVLCSEIGGWCRGWFRRVDILVDGVHIRSPFRGGRGFTVSVGGEMLGGFVVVQYYEYGLCWQKPVVTKWAAFDLSSPTSMDELELFVRRCL